MRAAVRRKESVAPFHKEMVLSQTVQVPTLPSRIPHYWKELTKPIATITASNNNSYYVTEKSIKTV